MNSRRSFHPSGSRRSGAQSVRSLDIESHPNGWPADAAFDRASTVVLYFDGLDNHPLLAPERRERFEAAMRAGVGLVVLHQASTVPATDRTVDLQRWLGGARYGMFDRATEMAEIAPATPAHPVSRGLAPFTYLDEFYPLDASSNRRTVSERSAARAAVVAGVRRDPAHDQDTGDHAELLGWSQPTG